MGKGSHSAAPNAIGYQHQTWWALVELLQTGASRPDAALSLELYDDVAWEQAGTATELFQVKHRIGEHRSLTDTVTDVWRTLKACCSVSTVPPSPGGSERCARFWWNRGARFPTVPACGFGR
ncbi:hypothetical protein RKD29_007798 [Streptomyces tendae]